MEIARHQVILSLYQVKPLLQAHRDGKRSGQVSLDLGLSTVGAAWDDNSVHFPDFPASPSLTWRDAEKIANSENGCFALESDGLWKIQTFSGETNRPISLYPTPGAPTMLIGGIPMHRIKETDPYNDTLAKVKTVAPIRGLVLDTCMGLGYTAIQAAKTAEHVITIELDPAVVEIAKFNPWSRALFDDRRIERMLGNAADLFPDFQGSTFDVIIHDPPMFSLAGELYSSEAYRELYRVLVHGGKMFHYVGDLESRSGRNVVRGVIERMQGVGFKHIVKRPEAFGLVAHK